LCSPNACSSLSFISELIYNASEKLFTLKDGTDFPKDGQAAGAEVLTEAELKKQQWHSDENDHHYVGNEESTFATEQYKFTGCSLLIPIPAKCIHTLL